MSVSRRALVLPAAALVAAWAAGTSGAVERKGKAGAMAGSIKSGGASAVIVEAARASLAPTGRLRVAINYGNTVLARKDPATGAPTGVSVVLARALAERLGVPVELIEFPAAGMVFEAMEKGAWDVAFMAIEPERAVKIDFSPAYVLIDGGYMVRADAPYRSVADLDKPGVRIAVAAGAAYDLYLSRNLKQATLIRVPTGPEAVKLFMADRSLEAVAGVRPFLIEMGRGKPAYRVLDGRFSRIAQAMAVPRGRGVAAAYVRDFIEAMKASGVVRKALDDSGQDGATVAPPA